MMPVPIRDHDELLTLNSNDLPIYEDLGYENFKIVIEDELERAEANE